MYSRCFSGPTVWVGRSDALFPVKDGSGSRRVFCFRFAKEWHRSCRQRLWWRGQDFWTSFCHQEEYPYQEEAKCQQGFGRRSTTTKATPLSAVVDNRQGHLFVLIRCKDHTCKVYICIRRKKIESSSVKVVLLPASRALFTAQNQKMKA